MILIPPSDLVCLDDYTGRHPLRIDLVYAQAGHKDNIFKEAIYRPQARMWGHRDFVEVIARAADLCHAETGYVFELKDVLRTVDAQERIVATPIVRANPHWTEDSWMFAKPGGGGHPRGMAADIILVTESGAEVDMGTAFDRMPESRTAPNPAARDFTALPAAVLERRRLLESCMRRAAAALGREMFPLPSEWWDFRFPPAVFNRFAPLRDADLPEEMRMVALSPLPSGEG